MKDIGDLRPLLSSKLEILVFQTFFFSSEWSRSSCPDRGKLDLALLKHSVSREVRKQCDTRYNLSRDPL